MKKTYVLPKCTTYSLWRFINRLRESRVDRWHITILAIKTPLYGNALIMRSRTVCFIFPTHPVSAFWADIVSAPAVSSWAVPEQTFSLFPHQAFLPHPVLHRAWRSGNVGNTLSASILNLKALAFPWAEARGRASLSMRFLMELYIFELCAALRSSKRIARCQYCCAINKVSLKITWSTYSIFLFFIKKWTELWPYWKVYSKVAELFPGNSFYLPDLRLTFRQSRYSFLTNELFVFAISKAIFDYLFISS